MALIFDIQNRFLNCDIHSVGQIPKLEPDLKFPEFGSFNEGDVLDSHRTMNIGFI